LPRAFIRFFLAAPNDGPLSGATRLTKLHSTATLLRFPMPHHHPNRRAQPGIGAARMKRQRINNRSRRKHQWIKEKTAKDQE